VGDGVKLICRFCKILFICETFEQVGGIQNEQCYITREGITHSLTARVTEEGESEGESDE